MPVCLNSDILGFKTQERLLNLNQFCAQDKTTHKLLETQKTFNQFGERTEASTPVALSAEKTRTKSLINFISQVNIVFTAFK